MSCLDRMDLSQSQLMAVHDRHPRVLVAAGAGSGKTRLLVACVVHAFVDEGLPVERLMAVTFTRKAGVELVSRLRESLEGCGRFDLARSLDLAATGTIHSLCRRLVKDKAVECGVDPACTVLEAEAAALIQKETAREIWERAVEQADETRLEVLAGQGGALAEDVVRLYNRLRGAGQEPPRIAIQAGPTREQAGTALLRSIDSALLAGAATPKRSKTLEADLSTLAACRAWLEGTLGNGPTTGAGASAEAQLRASADYFPTRKTQAMEPYFEPVRKALTQYRCAMAQDQLQPLVETANALLVEFHRFYTTRKQEQGLVDFADLEIKARDLVMRSGRGGNPALVGSGTLLLIDEFQDTNELQCSILEGLGADRMLMVGDAQQSIYRFRGADVDVFKRREDELERCRRSGDVGASSERTTAAAKGADGALHHLDMNYRSRPEVLEFINRLFAQEAFFGEDFRRLEADPERVSTVTTSAAATGAATIAANTAAATAAAGTEGSGSGAEGTGRHGMGGATVPAVEVIVAHRADAVDPDGRRAPLQQSEAEAVAGRIRSLVREEGWRQRDVVVLLPAQTHVELYQDALRTKGIEVYVVRGKGYYAQDEVTDVMALLQLLVNPHDDLALVTVLRSPLVGLSDDALYLLGKQAKAGRTDSLWGAVRAGLVDSLAEEDRRSLAGFVTDLDAMRRRVGRPGLPRLIDDAVARRGYDLCLLGFPGGRRRFANLRKLLRLAGEFESINGPDVAGFVETLRSMDDLGDKEGSAPTLAEGEDVVRVMTIHQAKGLEFPVVVLAGLGSDVPQDSPGTFVVGNDGRVGVFLRGFRHKTYEATDPCWGPAAEIVAEEAEKEREEDVRLLYVAMTRAEERLILVGAGPRDGRADRSRIARIVTALGLEAPPGESETVALEGLDAVVRGVGTSPEEPAEEPPLGTSPVAGTSAAQCFEAAPAEGQSSPQFLEMPRPVSRTRQVSFSALAAYHRCPRRYYLEQVLGLASYDVPVASTGPSGTSTASEAGLVGDADREAPEDILLDPEERVAGRDAGLLVHSLLERAPTDGAPPGVDEMRREAADWCTRQGITLSPDALERVLALTLAFWSSPAAGLLAEPGVQREAPFFFSQGATVVSGVMDLVSMDGPHWRIVDYKTNALGGRNPADVVSIGYRLQWVTYCLAALRAGATAVQMDFVFLERPAEPVTVSVTPDDIAALEVELDEALEGLRQGSFPAERGEGCETCAVAPVCAGMRG